MISSAPDQPAVEPVLAGLQERGLRTVFIRTDDVHAGRQQLKVQLDGSDARFTVDEHSFSPEEVSVAWWRKPQWLGLNGDDRARRLSLAQEFDRAHREISALIPDKVWLNAPAAMQSASRFAQLRAAAAIGMRVPSTVTTNQWRHVLPNAEGDVIFKSFRGSLTTEDADRVVFTNRLTKDDVQRLSAAASPYPGYFQPFIAKRAEWRVYMVGRRLLSVRITTELAQASVDWRREHLDAGVDYAVAALPAEPARLVAELVDHLGLRYAAVDLIEAVDGSFWFLEANPNGQYLWLEQQAGLPVASALVDALCSILSPTQ